MWKARMEASAGERISGKSHYSVLRVLPIQNKKFRMGLFFMYVLCYNKINVGKGLYKSQMICIGEVNRWIQRFYLRTVPMN